MSEEFKIDHTGRGFELIKFKDRYGAECSLQQSSLADFEQPGSSAIWFGLCGNEPKRHMGESLGMRMHLSFEQVKGLIPILQRWVDTGSFLDTGKSDSQEVEVKG